MATEEDDRASSTYRASAGIFIVLGGLFVWAGILTYSPLDWPSMKVSPNPWPPHNACGRAGAFVAYQLFYHLGGGTYLLALAVSIWAGFWLVRGHVPGLLQRTFGVSLLVILLGGITHLLWPGSEQSLPEGNGGVVGIAVANFLTHNFSTWGTVLILGYAFFVGLVFTSEGLAITGPKAVGRSVRSASTLGLEWARTRPWARSARGMEPAMEAVRPVPTPSSPALEPEPQVIAPIEAPAEPKPKPTGRVAAAAAAVRAIADKVKAASRPPEPTPVVPRLEPERPVVAPTKTVRAPTESPSPARSQDGGELIVKSHGLRSTANMVPPEAYPQELGDWELPSPELLEEQEYSMAAQQETAVRDKARILERTLRDFRLEAKVVEIDTGPVITLYELWLAAGVKVSRIVALSNDIARALKAPAVRVVAPIPGKNTVGIEVPNLEKEKVRLRELMALSGQKPLRMHLPLFIGKDASGNPLVADLAAMPHLLIAGTTGSGKSVCINSIIMSLLMTQRPDAVKLILVDPKMVELSLFKTVPHLMAPIITEVPRAEMVLDWAATKMDERYELLAEAGVRNIGAYNRLGRDEILTRFQPTTEEEQAQIPIKMPFIVIIIDELADLMMQSGKTVELQLSRLAQKSRAVGIHIVVATQRPEAKVVTGLIKSNLPCRIAFRVASRIDSRIVLDQNGAEVLMGQGDMLYLPPGSAKLVRAQGTFIEDSELKNVIDDLATKGEPEFHPELMKIRLTVDGDGSRDDLFDEGVRIVLETGRGSVSLLQRRLMIGYSRASRLIDQMADAGVVGAYKGSQAREVVITLEDWEKHSKAPRAEAPIEDPLPRDQFPVKPRFQVDVDEPGEEPIEETEPEVDAEPEVEASAEEGTEIEEVEDAEAENAEGEVETAEGEVDESEEVKEGEEENEEYEYEYVYEEVDEEEEEGAEGDDGEEGTIEEKQEDDATVVTESEEPTR